ncbi:MAG: hypothetical protein RR320_07520 [Oscillospiraceae bacterium]
MNHAMNKNLTSTMAGVAVGMVAGTAAYMMSGHSAHGQTKKLKKSAARAVRSAGAVIDTVSQLMR